ncbi:HD family phosphohydrolase [Nitrincola tapanii]|uniref:GAF domain-containing protein n=1 Tax=Nitrincola tapanii TaxID=1708751 RepID=A0A5A9W6H4_9GAMM|nr:HD family phosphohydrolase [Nitrincola tapanii]KAA0876282.1 GAF domain-containing protein [Nitrincola tapanii]
MGEHLNITTHLEYLNKIGIELSAQTDINRLLEMILLTAKKITNADGGTLYLTNDDARSLKFVIVRTDSLGIAFGGSHENEIPFQDLQLFNPDGSENHSMVVAHAAHTGQSINIEDAYHAEGFDFSGTQAFDKQTGYRSKSFLTVPMKNHEGELIGVLQLLNALDPLTDQVIGFPETSERLVNSLASQAAVALSNRQLIQQLSDLFEAFINLINVAIDEKSPHTSGHCQRVPEITMMIADALHASNEPEWNHFSLSEKDRHELRIASLLHDCGKITTPTHIVDKSTRLETIFDRIHLLNARFEIIKRDLEITFLRQCLEGGHRSNLEAEFNAKKNQLDKDIRFIQHINQGSTYLTDEHLSNLEEIRHRYDFQIDEVTYPILNEHEYENLSVRGGTLTQAEREIMNQHIVTTIKMLEALPWPKRLARVPEFAGGHHERMDGKGYPKGLKGQDMSVQARVMAIADIFEALTASDRPYKKPNTVSESLSILVAFANNGHIDPDIFKVFLTSKVWGSYAADYLIPEQRDDVDINALLSKLNS